MWLRRSNRQANDLPTIRYRLHHNVVPGRPYISLTSDAINFMSQVDRCAHRVPQGTRLAGQQGSYLFVTLDGHQFTSDQLVRTLRRFFKKELAARFTLEEVR